MTNKEVKAIAKLMGATKLAVYGKNKRNDLRLYHASFSDEHSWGIYTNSHEAFIERLGHHITEYQQEEKHGK